MSGNCASLLNWRVRQTVVDQKRCAFRRKDCSPPEDGDLERQHGIEQRATALRAVEIIKRRLQLRRNVSQIHGSSKNLELIAEITQTFQPMIDIEKSRLPVHRIPRFHPPGRNRKNS